MTDIAKIRSPGAQTVAPGLAYIVLSERQFESEGAVDGNTSGSSISVSEAGFYLVTFEVYEVGAGEQIAFLAGNAFTSTANDFIAFVGDALGVSHGRTVIVRADAGANFAIQVLNNGGGNVTYTCALAVCRLGAVG